MVDSKKTVKEWLEALSCLQNDMEQNELVTATQFGERVAFEVRDVDDAPETDDYSATEFVTSFSALQRSVHRTAVEHGWHNSPLTNDRVGALLALIHSEVSEALEDLRERGATKLSRAGEPLCQKPTGFMIEIADVVIRCMDLCELLGLPLAGAIVIKAEHNKMRPNRHGGKSL